MLPCFLNIILIQIRFRNRLISGKSIPYYSGSVRAQRTRDNLTIGRQQQVLQLRVTEPFKREGGHYTSKDMINLFFYGKKLSTIRNKL